MKKLTFIIFVLFLSITLSSCGKSLEERQSEDLDKLKSTLIEEGWDCSHTKCTIRVDDEPYESTASDTKYTTTGWDIITFDIRDYTFTISSTNSISSDGYVGDTNLKITSVGSSTFTYVVGSNQLDFTGGNFSQTKFNDLIQPDRTTSESFEGYYLIENEEVTCIDSDDKACIGIDNLCENWYDYLLNIIIESEIDTNNFIENE